MDRLVLKYLYGCAMDDKYLVLYIGVSDTRDQLSKLEKAP